MRGSGNIKPVERGPKVNIRDQDGRRLGSAIFANGLFWGRRLSNLKSCVSEHLHQCSADQLVIFHE